jgi:diacylglycerol kinase
MPSQFQAKPSIGYWQKRVSSFGYALRGLYDFFSSEAHAQFHALAACLVGLLGIWLDVSPSEWMWLLLAVAIVLVSEAFNSALESTCNAVSQSHNEHIRKAKDKAAGAVLMSSLAALAIGAVVFLPKILALL